MSAAVKGVTDSCVSFTIDATPLKRVSKRPHHLEERFNSSSRTPHGSIEAVSAKRDELIQARRNDMARRVKHAKKVANQVRKLSNDSATKRRQEIQNRQVVRAARREVLQRVSRSKHLHEGQAEIHRMFVSCKRIQRWWKAIALKAALKNLEAAAVHVAAFGSISFDQMVQRIQEEPVVDAVSKFIRYVNGTAQKTENDGKIFLSAFMVSLHPNEIFAQPKPDDMHVKTLADALISEYEQALKLQKITVGLKNSWTDFRKGFNAWKAKDNKAMIDGLIEHFMQLEQLWSSVKENIDAESQWRPKIEKQQRLIRSKIQRIGGRSALARLALEVRKFRPSDSGTNINVLPESNSGHESKNSVLNSSYEFFPSSNEASADVVNDLKKFGSFLSNEQLAHELIMDPNFELGRDSKTEMEKQITEVVKRAYFDKIRQDLTDNKIESTLMVIEDIRGQILSMVNEKGSMHRKIAAELDLVVIKQQIEQGIFAWKEYLQHACSIMLQLCAPARDQRIRAILENGDVVESVREIFEALEMMKLDLANFRLQSLRPVLMQQAAEYERAKFEHALSNGQVSLENAAKWIQASVNKAKEVSTARNPENVELPGNNVKFENVYIDALLSTIFSSEPIDAECFPETLSMDYARISSFQNEAQAIAVVAALLMLSRNLSADFRDDFNAVQTLKEQLFLFLQDADTSIDNLAHLIISSISKVLAQSNKSLTEEQKDMVRNMVDKTMSYRDTVFSLLHRRIMNEVRVHLVSGRFRKDTNNGLDVVIQEVEGLSGKIFRLVSHNRSVYAKWYDEMIRQAMNA